MRLNGARPASQFEQIVMPHLDAAYNFARWLSRNDADAEDVTQQACLRALMYFDPLECRNPKAWLLQIVRNTFRQWLEKRRPVDGAVDVEDAAAAADGEYALGPTRVNFFEFDDDPETLLINDETRKTLRRMIDRLPTAYREALILREFEDLSYREIARVLDVRLGTVMSRLARARERLRADWQQASQPILAGKMVSV